MMSPLWSQVISGSNRHSSVPDTNLASVTIMPLTTRVYGDSSYSQRKNFGIVGYGACAILYEPLCILDPVRIPYRHTSKGRKDKT